MKYSLVTYPDKLRLEYLTADQWKLTEDFRCFYKQEGVEEEQLITVPAGFNNDLASIPQMFQNIIPVVGPQNLPSVVHDWCYAHKWRTREDCDALFLAGLAAVGIGWIKRNAMYLAVRAGGWFLWRKRKDTSWTLSVS